MKSLLNDDELETFLKSLEYPVDGVTVQEAYSLSEPDGFPCVVYNEIVNTPLGRPMTTADGGLEEGPTRVAYEFTVLARDTKVGKRATKRSDVCRIVLDTVIAAMFNTYGMQRTEVSDCVPYDATCNLQSAVVEGVIDTHEYTYSASY